MRGTLLTPGRLIIAALVLIGIFAGSIGAGYLLGRTAFRRAAPPAPLSIPSPVLPPSSSGAAAPAAPRMPLAGVGPPPGAGGGVPAAPAAPPIESPEMPAPAPPSAVPPGPAPAATPAIPHPPARFHVQIGAFTERQNAEALVLRVRSLGYAVTLVEGPPFRVWVGGYLDRATAEKLVQHLKTAGFEAALTPR